MSLFDTLHTPTPKPAPQPDDKHPLLGQTVHVTPNTARRDFMRNLHRSELPPSESEQDFEPCDCVVLKIRQGGELLVMLPGGEVRRAHEGEYRFTDPESVKRALRGEKP